jgi:anti-sigma regulatory factor (Ser/Thr protein kinase)
MTLSITVSAQWAELAEVRDQLRRWLVDHGIAAALVDDLVLAVGEAATNAMEHGVALRPDARVTVRGRLAGPDLVIEVHDPGQWVATPSGADRGYGLKIMSSVVDDVEIETGDRGTTVRLRHQLKDQAWNDHS